MAKVKGKEQLCITENFRKYFKSIQGFESHSLFDRYDAIENFVNNSIDRNFRHFLAQPVVDDDLISWFSKPYNEMPQQLSALQGEEREKYELIKNETVAHYYNAINSLKQKGKKSEAECLENAIKFVDDRFVYCFDGKTVLGIWGMQLRNEVREPLGIAMKHQFLKKPKLKSEQQPEPQSEPQSEPQPETLISPFVVRFNSGEGGNLNGLSVLSKHNNEIITEDEVPNIETKEGYEFIGWDKNPHSYSVTGDTEFTAQYSEIPPIVPIARLPWYKRLWNWLRTMFLGKGCLKWLLWLLLLLLLLFLIWWLFRGCNRGGVTSPIHDPIANKPWIGDDPRSGRGGIYNPGDPYTPKPTPPDYGNILPPQQGVIPPLDNPEIIRDPGMPAIIGNRLNILMENEDKSILDLAKEFKVKYPDDKYKVVYYDDVVKRLQIEVPKEEREKLKQEIPGNFAPQYKLFVFDEALFEGSYTPNDPAFKDQNKSWYLFAIKAPKAWDIIRGAPKLTVAIVDNGFNLKHPELNSKVVMPYNVWLHSKEIFPQKEEHGTHVAGTALAIGDNGIGICGVAFGCSFMPIQVADKNDFMTTTSVLDGILYALYQGADVVNVSLGTKFTGLDKFPEDYQRELIQNHFKEEERLWNEIMKIADKHKSTIIVAAGNDNVLAGIDPLQRPNNIITVSAVNKSNQSYSKANFSNYGLYSTISAPGVDIYSIVGNGDFATMDGTSMAAPIVTGSVALMKCLNKNLTSEQIICILQATGIPVNGKIGNLIQLDKALQKVQSGKFSDCIPQASTGDVQVLLSWNNYNDLDLACIDPVGNTVWYNNKSVPSGGMLEIDMNVNPNDSKTPIENIYWPEGRAPNGTYEVYLWLYKQHEPAINETPYKVSVKYGDKTEEFSGTIKKEDDRLHICTFTLGNDNNSRNTNKPDNPNTLPNNRRDELQRERERLQKELDRIDHELRSIRNNKFLKK